jgi:prevent-host-death family protein
MTAIGAFGAKNQLSQLLDRVLAGERITITRNGTPVAELVPLRGESTRADARQAIAELLAFRDHHALVGVTVRELIDEGRRF